MNHRSPKILGVCLLGLTAWISLAQQVSDPDFDPTITAPAYAKGTGPLLLIDAAHHNFHTADGRYKPFADLLRNDGYRVASSEAQFTDETLADTDILAIVNALHHRNVRQWTLPTPSAFTTEEIRVVHRWVKQGGALLLIADHMPFPGAASDLARSFGFEFNNGFARIEGNAGRDRFHLGDGSLNDHAIIRGRNKSEAVDSVVTFTGQGFQSPPEASPLLVFIGPYVSLMPQTAWQFDEETPRKKIQGWHQGAVFRYGKGRVAVFGEAAAFTAQRSGANQSKMGMNAPEAQQNAQFILNVTHWLSGLL